MYQINTQLLGLEDSFTFGKHVGEQVEDVIEDNPKYITWCYENDIVEFDEDTIAVLEKKKII